MREKKLLRLTCVLLVASATALICHGTCDNKECDFVANMCLNTIDMEGGYFNLPSHNCKPKGGGIFLEVFLFIYSMLGLAIVCDDYLCVALERLCEEFNIREDVAGATFMALGSAAPEIILNTVGTVKQTRSWPPDSVGLEATNIGVGAILGSGMIAMLVIPGCCAIFKDGGIDLLLKRRPLFRDICAYTIALAMLCIFMSDGKIKTYEGAILVLFYLLYVCVVFFSPTLRTWYRVRFLRKEVKKRPSFVNDNKGSIKQKPSELHNPLLTAVEEGPIGAGSSGGVGGKKVKSSSVAQLFPSLGVVVGEGDNNTDEDNDDCDDDTVAQAEQAFLRGESCHSHRMSSTTGSLLDEAEGEEGSMVITALRTVLAPLNFLFEYTCIDCSKGGTYEQWYPLTFAASLLWVSFFSVLISSIVERWTVFSPGWMNGSFFGLLLCAVGAEIPDTIQSVAMARRGYGSMAVSNAIGSQVLNICMGLGLPWMCASFSLPKDDYFRVTDHANLQVVAFFQFGAVTANFVTLLGVAVYRGANKATLSTNKGYLLLTCYVIVIISYVTFKVISKVTCKDADDDDDSD